MVHVLIIRCWVIYPLYSRLLLPSIFLIKITKIGRYNCSMKQDAVIQILKQKNAELTNQFGVKSLLLFGSVARNEATAASDIDLLVEFNRPVGYFGLFALQDYLEKLLGCSVDLGTPNSLKPYIRDRIMGELIRVT
jgi:predicted nucleotidyltransferase